MKCLAQAVAEKSRGQDFQGQGHFGKVKGQSATKRDHCTPPHEDEYTEYEMPRWRVFESWNVVEKPYSH